jgi:hypothetical protein
MDPLMPAADLENCDYFIEKYNIPKLPLCPVISPELLFKIVKKFLLDLKLHMGFFTQ